MKWPFSKPQQRTEAEMKEALTHERLAELSAWIKQLPPFPESWDGLNMTVRFDDGCVAAVELNRING